ncbi:xanthine dehydrogenase accessory factor [Rhodoblastus acidophilus]|uniref:Xanthine dehydrogenase accessory factor n=1 Tax=Rhodoblastus acidophilus TaxID=1074 RepID=A0A212Q2W8_RHOAC|nr:XdhC family protein [Rhodoblastus acidophilus]PPQ37166.1 hypothetical protein CKO16_15425 [Rhodoblastus acidophilus]RAI18125.1 hypothetical protein CH337_14900 [Rhodoblastus acidophilus]SNB53703.1 xanthine dehydrogenase accessory factor [Rhodoblastus acidophilus]
MSVAKDILDLVSAAPADGEAVAVATVVRAGACGKAKAGARTVIAADGALSGAWPTGDAGAVARAAREALGDGRPRLISLRSARGMQVLVEPMLPRPIVAVAGASPVAIAVCELARRMGFFVVAGAPGADAAAFPEADLVVDDLAPLAEARGDYLVVATQGKGDRAALEAMLRRPARYLALVGPPRRAAALKSALARKGFAPEALDRIRAPAGLDIDAVTPEEIALSIVAEMVALRRRGQRGSGTVPERRSLPDDRQESPT